MPSDHVPTFPLSLEGVLSIFSSLPTPKDHGQASGVFEWLTNIGVMGEPPPPQDQDF